MFRSGEVKDRAAGERASLTIPEHRLTVAAVCSDNVDHDSIRTVLDSTSSSDKT